MHRFPWVRAVRWRGALPVLIAACALPATTATAAPTAPPCGTPVAAHEPPCNPHLADSGWGASHRGSYASGASPYPGPRPADQVRWQHVQLPRSITQVPVVIDFSSAYPDGGRVAWMSTVSTPDLSAVHKVDVATGRVIDSATKPAAGTGASISGAYNLLDRDDHLFVGRARSLEVYGDARPGERGSPIAQLASFAVPQSALCGADDQLVGITMTYDGHIAFATERGAVGVVPRTLPELTAENVRSVQLNGERCTDGAPAADLEIVSNSISADEDGGIYVVTSKAMHRIQWDGRRLRSGWRARYETGTNAGGVRLGEGSGSTPDVVGTGRDRDRFVVITDGQPLMHLVLLWRDEIPAGWQPIAPGKDPRIACEIPVRFGDPTRTTSSSEQSVLTSGYSSFVVNNTLANEALFAALPPAQRRVAAALAGQDPLNAPYGMERIDWDPATRTCRSVWANPDVSIPNGIPTLSTASGLVYGQGQRLGTWGLEGLDIETGRQVLRVPASPGPDSNSLYAATAVGPDGAVWQGVAGGIDIYRGPVRPAPATRCFDLDRPRLAVLSVRGRRLSGRATDRACGAATRPLVRVVVRRGGRVVARPRTRADAQGRFALTLPPRGREALRIEAVATDPAGLRSVVRRRVLR
ncbi:hypothetical protein GKE82_11090 [Conexibacter sp. W3-3-2]|uniref:hypothetical protein n=1 Tax=Conexibacter sp. W3-3-2 TaxID=2675227 RepID=UPI0012B70702|nr:hypothetical protein [Conexibacter sp. W3-3-2]MTD44820.1 hypothetical protein [Conexibacter sp. W3-3-2]